MNSIEKASTLNNLLTCCTLENTGLDEQEIFFEELPSDLQLIASKLGIEASVDLLRYFPGTSIYIPRISKLTDYVIRYIRANEGKSCKEIATALGVSENFIRKLQYEL
jgi:hypothetical protein